MNLLVEALSGAVLMFTLPLVITTAIAVPFALIVLGMRKYQERKFQQLVQQLEEEDS